MSTKHLHTRRTVDVVQPHTGICHVYYLCSIRSKLRLFLVQPSNTTATDMPSVWATVRSQPRQLHYDGNVTEALDDFLWEFIQNGDHMLQHIAQLEKQDHLFARLARGGDLCGIRKRLSWGGGIRVLHDGVRTSTLRDPGHWMWGRSYDFVIDALPSDHVLAVLEQWEYTDVSKGELLEAILALALHHESHGLHDSWQIQLELLVEFVEELWARSHDVRFGRFFFRMRDEYVVIQSYHNWRTGVLERRHARWCMQCTDLWNV